MLYRFSIFWRQFFIKNYLTFNQLLVLGFHRGLIYRNKLSNLLYKSKQEKSMTILDNFLFFDLYNIILNIRKFFFFFIITNINIGNCKLLIVNGLDSGYKIPEVIKQTKIRDLYLFLYGYKGIRNPDISFLNYYNNLKKIYFNISFLYRWFPGFLTSNVNRILMYCNKLKCKNRNKQYIHNLNSMLLKWTDFPDLVLFWGNSLRTTSAMKEVRKMNIPIVLFSDVDYYFEVSYFIKCNVCSLNSFRLIISILNKIIIQSSIFNLLSLKEIIKK